MSDLLAAYPIVRVTAESFSELPENTRVILCVKDETDNYISVSWNDYRNAVLKSPPAANWTPSNKDYDRSIHSNPCHLAWARFFTETFPNCGADEDTMAGWFANAMMAKYDSPPAAKVPESKKLPELMMAQYHEAIGWNACREAMLSAQEREK